MCRVWVTLLSQPALERMHQTEGGYDYVALPASAACLLPDGPAGPEPPPARGGPDAKAGWAAWPARTPLHTYVSRCAKAGPRRALRAGSCAWARLLARGCGPGA